MDDETRRQTYRWVQQLKAEMMKQIKDMHNLWEKLHELEGMLLE